MASNRNLHIDTLRGIACLLLVAFHVVGYNAESGLLIAEGAYRSINDSLAYVRMPLFTFLSGVVYAYRPFSGDASRFVRGKVRRLLVPLLVVGTLFAFVQTYAPGSNNGIENWYLLHIIPVGHFWFIQAIFIIFMLMIPLELSGALKSPGRFAVVFLAASLLFVSNIYINYFAIAGAIYLLPYFLLGMATYRFGCLQSPNRVLGIALLGVALFGIFLIYQGFFTQDGHRTPLALAIGSLACLGLLALGLKSALLARIGAYSYSIYLYHVFFSAATRTAINQLGISDIHIMFAIGLITGILGPIALDKAFSGANICRLAFLGKPPAPTSSLWLEQMLAKLKPKQTS